LATERDAAVQYRCSADEDIDSTFPTNVVVSSNGDCLWVPPGLFLSTCKIDITWFPFDDQLCEMKFGSWTYDMSGIDLQLKGNNSGDTTSFIPNGEWHLIGTYMPRHPLALGDLSAANVFQFVFSVGIIRRYMTLQSAAVVNLRELHDA